MWVPQSQGGYLPGRSLSVFFTRDQLCLQYIGFWSEYLNDHGYVTLKMWQYVRDHLSHSQFIEQIMLPMSYSTFKIKVANIRQIDEFWVIEEHTSGTFNIQYYIFNRTLCNNDVEFNRLQGCSIGDEIIISAIKMVALRTMNHEIEMDRTIYLQKLVCVALPLPHPFELTIQHRDFQYRKNNWKKGLSNFVDKLPVTLDEDVTMKIQLPAIMHGGNVKFNDKIMYINKSIIKYEILW